MNNMKLLFGLAVLAALMLSCASAQSCTAGLNATRQASWVDNGQDRSLWTVVITATGQLAVTNVLLNIEGPINQIWEVVLVNGSLYRLPDWRLQVGGIPAGQSHVFGFIINNANTNSPVSIVSVNCGNVTASPSPSASPAASPSPSPSSGATPSANPSPSPSAGVCSLAASQAARSGAGSSWTDNAFRYQIYDVAIANNGSRSLRSGSIAFNIAADQDFSQWWNLQRVDASSTFTIDSFLLPAPGGSQTGLGYVLRTPLNSTSDGSSIGSVAFAC